MNGAINEPDELRKWQRSQEALQLAEAIDRVAAIARESGFSSVGVMLEMARDLARSEHAKAEESTEQQALDGEPGAPTAWRSGAAGPERTTNPQLREG